MHAPTPWAWLKTLEFEEPADRYSFHMYFLRMQQVEEHLKEMDRRLESIAWPKNRGVHRDDGDHALNLFVQAHEVGKQADQKARQKPSRGKTQPMVVRGPHATKDVRTVGRVFLILGVCFLCGGVGAWAACRHFRDRHAQLVQGGLRLSAVVDQKYAAGGRGIRYFVVYKFLHQGRMVLGEARVSKSAFLRAREGGPLAVRMDPEDPSRSTPEDGAIDSAGQVFWILALVFTILGVVFGFVGSLLRMLGARGARVGRTDRWD